MDRAIAYIRVSTEEQANEGISLEAQEAKVRAYCELRGLELVDVVKDAGVSAGKALDRRAGGARVLDLVRRKKVSAVVALKLDRLFRNAADCLTVVEGWDRRGVGLHLIDMGGTAFDTSSAMGKFFLTVMAGAAEMERNLVSERTSAALQHKRTKGEYTGGRGVPFGKRVSADGVHLEADEKEQRVLHHIRELEASGLSRRAIASVLNADGVPARGKRWHHTTIQRVLKAA